MDRTGGKESLAPVRAGAGIKAVIFDLGRVLVEITTGGEKFSTLMREIGIPPEQAFQRFWNEPEVLRHGRGEIDSHEFHRLARERFHLSLGFERFAEAWCDLFRPIPEMEKLFMRLAGRCRLGLLSDTDPLHWAWLRRRLPWLERVEHPTLSHETGFLKPHPEAFRLAVVHSGAERAGECLFVDDLPANVEAARNCGLQARLFTGAGRLEEDFKRLGLL